MNISKKGRLLSGLIILFSITFFMGTNKSTGCLDCDVENNGSIILINNSFTAHRFIIDGETDITKVVSGGNRETVWVEQGKYTVFAWGNPPYYSVLSGTWNFNMEPAGSQTCTVN